LRFRSRQSPAFSAPGHRSGKVTALTLSSRPERSAAEGSAVALSVATEPSFFRPWPPFRESHCSHLVIPTESEAQRRDLQLRFRSQQNPTFSAPGHRSGKPLLSPFVIPTGAEGSAVALQVSTKPHLLRPWPPFREATALTLSSRPERRDLQLPSRSNEAAPFFPSNQGTRRNSVYTFPTLKCTLQRRKR
jgi:hypothetical protein